MIEPYRKRRNISFSIFILGWVLLYALSITDPEIEEVFLLFSVLLINIWALSYFYGCYCWAKAKGFRWHVGIGFSLLSFIGIIILWALKDKSTPISQPASNETN